MGSTTIFDSVVSLLIMILVGAYSARKKTITPELNRGLTTVLIQIALPCMILSSFIFTYDESMQANVFRTFLYSMIAYAITIVISQLLLLPVRNNKKTVLHFANVFSNTGYVGFPILNSVYGSEGIVYGSVFNMFFVFLVWTYGLLLYRGKFARAEFKAELKKVLLNPSILAVGAGLIIMTSGLQVPNGILASIRAIGNMTGPLSMLVIGAILAEVKLGDHLKDWTIYYGITTKLVIIPLLIYLFSLLTGEPSKVTNTVVIMTAMPAATMTSIFAERFDRCKDYAALIVAATTMLSLLTIPILLKTIM